MRFSTHVKAVGIIKKPIRWTRPRETASKKQNFSLSEIKKHLEMLLKVNEKRILFGLNTLGKTNWEKLQVEQKKFCGVWAILVWKGHTDAWHVMIFFLVFLLISFCFFCFAYRFNLISFLVFLVIVIRHTVVGLEVD